VSGPRPISLALAALGGQGGGVVTDWLTQVAAQAGYLAQATSVPGVAQRTGATLYYLEFFPETALPADGRRPVMALMPGPGDVDVVVATELIEAGRMIERGLVTPERTTLIASTHRAYAIGEKSALGSGMSDVAQLLELVRAQGRQAIVFDMEDMAQRHHSLISAVLLGAVSGAGVLPFAKQAFMDAIRDSGLAVATNLAAFEDAHRQAAAGGPPAAAAPAARLPAVPQQAHCPALQPLLERIRRLPGSLQPCVLEGTRRTLDYQDAAYAALYLERLENLLALDRSGPPGENYALSEATARGLALWMTFEDTIRVADLKTRATRLPRVAAEVRARPGQLFGITEFMRPRVGEIAGTLPAAIGAWLLRSPRLARGLDRWTGGRQVRTRTVTGYLLLRAVAALRRFRRGTLRYREENARIEAWLQQIARHATGNHALALELARAQRLIKGYGETHERGWRNFCALGEQLERLAARTDGAPIFARLAAAALADEEGAQLAREIAALDEGAAA
jgi:indolepyruvate ferredoxin oxidoreductase, beta subunit